MASIYFKSIFFSFLIIYISSIKIEAQSRSIYRFSPIARRIVNTTAAPTAIGAYNQAIQAGNTLYVSGNIGLDPKTGNLVPGGVIPEAQQALYNMGRILQEAGCTYDNVVKTQILLANISDFSVVNDIYKSFFVSNYPARTTFQVAALPKGAQIEIEAIAVVGDIIDMQF